MLAGLYTVQRRLDSAQAEYEKVLARDPKSLPANTLVALIMDAQGKQDDAKRLYERILEMHPNAAVAANNLAWIYVERGENLDRALELAQKAKEQLPSNSNVNDTLGWIYYKKNLLGQALPLLEESVAKDAANPLLLYHLGMAYVKSGDIVKGRQSLEKALKLRPDFPGSQEAKSTLAAIAG